MLGSAGQAPFRPAPDPVASATCPADRIAGTRERPAERRARASHVARKPPGWQSLSRPQPDTQLERDEALDRDIRLLDPALLPTQVQRKHGDQQRTRPPRGYEVVGFEEGGQRCGWLPASDLTIELADPRRRDGAMLR